MTPSELLAVHPTSSLETSASFVGGDLPEDGVYVGIPLLVVFGLSALWLWRRRPLVRVTAIGGAAAGVFALGSRLIVSGSPGQSATGGVPLPNSWVAHLPFLTDGKPIRFSLYLFLCIGETASLALDGLVALTHEARRAEVIVAQTFLKTPLQRDYFPWLIGRPPDSVRGVDLWLDVPWMAAPR